MGIVIRFASGHARTSSRSADVTGFRAANSAKTSSVMPGFPRSAAKATTAAQCGAGIPRVCQPLTVDADCPRDGATSPVRPRASMTDFQVTIPGTIVRKLRTCQPVAICETTFREIGGEVPPMDSDVDIARRLIAVREHFGLSQAAFADKLHIAKNTLNGYEKAKRQLTIETASRIRDRYGVSVDWLLFGDIGQPSHDLAVRLGPKPQIEADAKRAAQAGKRRKAS